jgi:6-carboxyhexanoate--CoA ligase
MIMDALTGDRLEPDKERGIRASRFDWSAEASEKIDCVLSDIGLTHFRTREALALATKVAHAPGIVAELCWSDDPDYTAGYVSSPSTGYVRFPFLKNQGIDRGGRAFFVQREEFHLDSFIRYLQEEPVLITAAGKCGPHAGLNHV